jgi:hypothetical protein
MKKCICGRTLELRHQLVGMFIITEYFCPVRRWFNFWNHSCSESVR